MVVYEGPVAPQAPPRSRVVSRLVDNDRDEATVSRASLMEKQARQRQQQIAATNYQIHKHNSRLYSTLESSTGTNLKREPTEWWKWWEDYNEVVSPKPTYHRDYYSESVFTTTYRYENEIVPLPSTSCFAADTPVWTERGLANIQDVLPGDRVLSCDPDTGELAFRVVLQTTVAEPTTDMMLVRTGEDEIYMTRAHVIWVAGKGWRMAKRLAVGDRLVGRSTSLKVEELTQLPPPQRVYNLVVAGFHTYFVGNAGVLVHDITMRRPTASILPGLAAK